MSFTPKPNTRRIKVFAKTNGLCSYCGKELNFKTYHIDHLVASANKGANHVSNYMPACPPCNMSKGSRTLEDYRFLLSFRREFKDAPTFPLLHAKWLHEHEFMKVSSFVSFYFEVM